MNRRNYSRELDRIIDNSKGRKPKLLLHSCCGPCSTSVLEYLSSYFDITILWYNPNLYPKDEFDKRLATLREVVEKMGFGIDVIEMPWNHEDYLSVISDEMKNEDEGGHRCEECFRLRLEQTARTAAEREFDYFCTTLTVSRHKDAVLINRIGEEQSEKFGAKWLPSDFKKRNGENRSQMLSEQLGIYRQLYCGCEFSLYKRNSGMER